MSKQNEREVQNLVVVAGELIDLVDVKEEESKSGKTYFKYVARVEVKEGQTFDVEFFTMKHDSEGKVRKLYKAMDTIEREAKTRVKDGKGDTVRCTGAITVNSYLTKDKTEIISKLVVKGNSLKRDKGKEKDLDKFKPGASLKCVGLVDEIIKESDEKVIFKTLINEYKSKKDTIGYMIELVAEGKGAVEGTSFIKKDDILPFGANLVNDVETKFLPEDETCELSTEGAWGSMLEEIEKKNEVRKRLREEGIKKYSLKLVLTGNKALLTSDQIEEQELNFTDDDINDMFDYIEDKMNELEDGLVSSGGTSSDVAF